MLQIERDTVLVQELADCGGYSDNMDGYTRDIYNKYLDRRHKSWESYVRFAQKCLNYINKYGDYGSVADIEDLMEDCGLWVDDKAQGDK